MVDEAERAHLFDLARAVARSSRPHRHPVPKQRIRPGVQLALDAITGALQGLPADLEETAIADRVRAAVDPRVEMIGFTPTRSFAVKTTSRTSSGIWIARSRA